MDTKKIMAELTEFIKMALEEKAAKCQTVNGIYTKSDGVLATSFGYNTSAAGDVSTAFGVGTIAKGVGSLALGLFSTALGRYSTALGIGTTTNNPGEVAVGNYNRSSPSTLFSVGNGVGGATSNAFEVLSSGTVKATTFDGHHIGTFSGIGRDYAELFELDHEEYTRLNNTIEEKLGVNGFIKNRFVSFVPGEMTIRLTRGGENHVLGVVSQAPTVLGGCPVDKKKDTMYVPVGILGVLAVRDNGCCVPGCFCKAGFNGTAVPSDDNSGFYVIRRLNQSIYEYPMVEIFVR